MEEKMNAFDKLEKFMDNSNKQGGINGPISKKLQKTQLNDLTN